MKKQKYLLLFKNLLLILAVTIMLFLLTGNHTPANGIFNKQLIDSENFMTEKIEVHPNIQAHPLPLSTLEISNYENFFKKIPLDSEAMHLLKKMPL